MSKKLSRNRQNTMSTRTTSKNRYGLPRRPSVAVCKEIRRRCGFGCVICGDAIFTYEHFNPPFKDAKTHDPKGMTLLCGGHQLETSKGLLSKETIAKADASPFCKRVGYAKHLFDLGGRKPNLILGGANVSECGSKIEIDGQLTLQILPPGRKSNIWRLSCHFIKEDGTTLCEIVENELILRSDNVDIEQRGARLSIYSDKEAILELELQPPNALVIKKYCVFTPNGRVVIGPEKVPDVLHMLHHPDSFRETTVTTLRLETGGGVLSFAACDFIAPDGLRINFLDGAIQFQSP